MFFALKVSIHGGGVEMPLDYAERKTERTPETLNHISK